MQVSTVEQIIAALEVAILENAGVVETQIDGLKIRYASLDECARAMEYWERKLNRMQGKRPMAVRVDLSR